jgi:hypothetical protein
MHQPWHPVATPTLALALCLLGTPVRALDGDWNATVFTGRMTDAKAWFDVFTDPGDTDFFDSYLVAGAASYTFARYFEGDLSLEVEGQVVKHFGDQTHWEINLPVGARWHRFPWNETVATTAAFAVGPSYATEVPPVEVLLEGGSEKLMFHWFLELTLGPPGADWALSLRLHHRSGGFGMLADEGGADALAVGVRFGL